MANKRPSTKKLGLEIDAGLYGRLSRIAKSNGQSRRFLLEEALRLYLEALASSETEIRPQVMAAYRESVHKNRDLLRRLAQ
jgi:predicted transcriptional regulator